jgi:hypothetical protein
MSKAKHTPGPWRISGAAEGAGLTIEAKRNTLIAFVRDSQHPLTDLNEHEASANACLIAAAPEILEILRGIYEAATSYGRTSPEWLIERLAPAKALIDKL